MGSNEEYMDSSNLNITKTIGLNNVGMWLEERSRKFNEFAKQTFGNSVITLQTMNSTTKNVNTKSPHLNIPKKVQWCHYRVTTPILLSINACGTSNLGSSLSMGDPYLCTKYDEGTKTLYLCTKYDEGTKTLVWFPDVANIMIKWI